MSNEAGKVRRFRYDGDVDFYPADSPNENVEHGSHFVLECDYEASERRVRELEQLLQSADAGAEYRTRRIAELEAQNAELVGTLKTIAAQEHRFLGRGKFEPCAHGRYNHEDCDQCASDCAKAALASQKGG
jgi:hypothetical protein